MSSKIGKIGNKIPDISDNDTEMEEIERKIPDQNKCISINEFNKFSGTIFNERLNLKKRKISSN